MNLHTELQNIKSGFEKNLPANQLEIMQNDTNTLKKEKRGANAFNVGDYMPYFELPDAFGNKQSLDSFIKKGKTVISFYRGGWCPYCSMELRYLQEILPEIKALGASLVAISPETPDNSLSTAGKNKLGYTILSDIDNVVSKQVGLVFQISQSLRTIYSSHNIDVEKHNGNKKFEIPMPATYVINETGKIIYAFIPEDYTDRADPTEILKHLAK